VLNIPAALSNLLALHVVVKLKLLLRQADHSILEGIPLKNEKYFKFDKLWELCSFECKI
jgi:hypothetical protein